MIKKIMNLYKKITGEEFTPGDDLDEGNVAVKMCNEIDKFIEDYNNDKYSVQELCYFAFAIRHLEDYTFLDRKQEEIAIIDKFLLDVIEGVDSSEDKDYALMAYITRPILYIDGTDVEVYDSLKGTPAFARYMDGIQEAFERYESLPPIPKSIRVFIDRVLNETYNVWENYQADVGGTEYSFQQFLNSSFNFMFFKKEMEAHI